MGNDDILQWITELGTPENADRDGEQKKQSKRYSKNKSRLRRFGDWMNIWV